jgi:chemotaxis protein MotB
MAKKGKHPEHVNHERWLVSYADFITLLFAFFVVMFSVSQVDSKKMGRFTESFQHAIGIEMPQGGSGLMPNEIGPGVETDFKKAAKTTQAQKQALDQLASALEEASKIRSELQGMKIVTRGNELVLRLQETVLFPSAADQLRDPAVPVIRAIAEEIRSRPVRVRVEGHTDDRPISNGRYESNWDLSTHRATSVVKELAKSGLIEPERLAAVGYAEYQPIGDNSTEEGRAMNRRVDFVLTLDLPIVAEPPPAEETAEGSSSASPAASAAPSAAPREGAAPATSASSASPAASAAP